MINFFGLISSFPHWFWTAIFSVSEAGKLLYTCTVSDLIGARGAYVNLFSTTSAKRSSSGP